MERPLQMEVERVRHVDLTVGPVIRTVVDCPANALATVVLRAIAASPSRRLALVSAEESSGCPLVTKPGCMLPSLQTGRLGDGRGRESSGGVSAPFQPVVPRVSAWRVAFGEQTATVHDDCGGDGRVSRARAGRGGFPESSPARSRRRGTSRRPPTGRGSRRPFRRGAFRR